MPLDGQRYVAFDKTLIIMFWKPCVLQYGFVIVQRHMKGWVLSEESRTRGRGGCCQKDQRCFSEYCLYVCKGIPYGMFRYPLAYFVIQNISKTLNKLMVCLDTHWLTLSSKTSQRLWTNSAKFLGWNKQIESLQSHRTLSCTVFSKKIGKSRDLCSVRTLCNYGS